MPKGVTCIETGIVLGIKFVERAVAIALLTPETAQRCWLLKSPSVLKLLPPGALPTLPDDQDGHSRPT